MTTATDTPGIYVASLSDYVAGRLHGAWIDAAQDPDAIMADVRAMLAASPEPIAEEWAIHDYEGFGGIRIEEYASFEFVSSMALAIVDCPEPDAMAAWLSESGRTPDQFQDAYRGEWSSEEDYAQEDAEMLYGEDGLGPLAAHIDWESYARDLFMDLESHPAPGGGIYVFNPNAV